MARVDVLLLAQEISQGSADSLQLEKYYTETINELSNKGFFTETRIIDRNEDGKTYTKPADVNRILEVFYGDKVLGLTGIQQLSAINQSWRSERGQPTAYTFHGEDAGTFRLFPIPDIAAGPNSFITGEPEGEDFPSYAVTTVCTVRQQDVQDYLDLPIALILLQKEFSRESDHTDFAFAEICKQLSGLMLEVV